MVERCGGCKKFLSSQDGTAVHCRKCGNYFHRICVNVAEDAVVSENWLCPECKAAQPKPGYNNDITPINPGSEKMFHSTAVDDHTLEFREPPLAEEQRLLCEETRRLRDETRKAWEEMRAFRLEMQDLRALVLACDERLDRLESKVEKLASQDGAGVDGVGGIVHALEATVAQLQIDLNERDQELLLSDVDISGVPEEDGENPVHLAIACAVKLGMRLEERDVVSCVRVGGVRREGGRPRVLALRLARRAARTDLLKAARVRRNATTDGLGLLAEPRSFYVNERLTKQNRLLFNRARENGRRKGWRFVWTRDGRIYARKDSEAPANRIRSERDLEKVFGPE